MYDSLPRHRRLATRLVLWVKAVLVQLRLHGVVFIVDGSRVHDETQRQGQRPRQNGYSHQRITKRRLRPHICGGGRRSRTYAKTRGW
jgi:hypothetical protein